VARSKAVPNWDREPLGLTTDGIIGGWLGRHRSTVMREREKRGIPKYTGPGVGYIEVHRRLVVAAAIEWRLQGGDTELAAPEHKALIEAIDRLEYVLNKSA
jgi:hypothetical protein